MTGERTASEELSDMRLVGTMGGAGGFLLFVPALPLFFLHPTLPTPSSSIAASTSVSAAALPFFSSSTTIDSACLAAFGFVLGLRLKQANRDIILRSLCGYNGIEGNKKKK